MNHRAACNHVSANLGKEKKKKTETSDGPPVKLDMAESKLVKSSGDESINEIMMTITK